MVENHCIWLAPRYLPKLTCNLSLNNLGLSHLPCSLSPVPWLAKRKLDLWVSEQLFLPQASLPQTSGRSLSPLTFCCSFTFLTPTLLHWLRHKPRPLKTPPKHLFALFWFLSAPGNGAHHQGRTLSFLPYPSRNPKNALAHFKHQESTMRWG